jgi:hypothetical protein
MGSCRLLFLTLGSLLLAGCYSPVYKEAKPPPRAVGPPTAGPPGKVLPVVARDAALVAVHVLPNPKLTPGAIFERPKEDICKPGYTKSIRNVSSADKDAVFQAYGIHHRPPGAYEVDHLISLELGGSNDRTNLWPEPMHLNINGKDEGAKAKDDLENLLHAEVCAGRLTIGGAQDAIRGDWTGAYRKYFGEFPAFHSRPSSVPEVEKP